MYKRYFSMILFGITVLASLILHYPQLSKDLIGIHVWRQTQTQWNTLNFYRHDFNIFNPRTCVYDANGSNISRYEFPIMQWLVALVMKIFGDAIIVTRLSYFVVGVFSSLGIYKILKLLTGHELGSWMGAWAFTFSPVFFYYTINPLPDNFALMTGIWFLYYFLKYENSGKRKYILYSAIFLMFSALAKLPYIIFSAGVGYLLIKAWRKKETYQVIAMYFFAMIPVIAWYVWVIPGWGGNGVLYGVFENKVSFEHYGKIFEYHKNIMFPHYLMNEMSTYLFYMGILFLLLNNQFKRKYFWILFMSVIACIVYWLMELNMIDTIHDYYMMPFLPFLYLVVGYALISLWRSNLVLKIVALVFVVTMASVTYNDTKGFWSIEKSYTNPDIFIYKDDLRKAVSNNEKCFMASDKCHFIFPYMFDKMGYFCENDTYSADELKNLIDNKDVHYMYCSIRTIDSAQDLRPFLKRLIMQRGSIKVWELQTVQ